MSFDLIEFLVRVFALILLGLVWGWAFHEFGRWLRQALPDREEDAQARAWRELRVRVQKQADRRRWRWAR